MASLTHIIFTVDSHDILVAQAHRTKKNPSAAGGKELPHEAYIQILFTLIYVNSLPVLFKVNFLCAIKKQ